MKTSILTADIWQVITRTAKIRKKCYVAVAYFGKGGASMLPLKEGDILVVDASEYSVKAGQTSPSELLKLCKRGVKIYSYNRLHAKVFVFGNTMFIGSTNVSNNSSKTLQEAVIKTTDANMVNASIDFIKSLCLVELGPERLRQLEKIYRPPIIPGGGKKVSKDNFPAFYICRLKLRPYSEGHEKPLKQGREEARKLSRNKKFHALEEFEWFGNVSFKKGDIILQVTDEGNSELVSPPGTVINIKKWRNMTRSFVFLEVPEKRRKSIDAVAKHIDARILSRSGKKNSDVAKGLAAVWH